MLKNKYSGQNLIEMIIILAIVVIGSVLILTIFGSNVNKLFSKSNEETKKYKPFDYNNQLTSNNNSNDPQSGDYIYDDNSNLTINLDGLTISDIPGDFYQVLQTSGSSGGTEKLAEIVAKLAAKLEAKGDLPLEQIKVLQDMASKAREMADVEKQIEALSKGVVEFCSAQPNSQDCSYTGYYDNGGRELVVKLAGENGHDGLNGEFNQYINSDDYKNFKNLYPESSILVELLRNEISNIALKIEINDRSLGDNGAFEDGKVRAYNAQDILTPGFENPSRVTDIDGALICHIGNGKYNPNGCN
ncbi:MAG: hypothetical protein AB1782_05885 [Cyanobacteriota bacterium]